MSEYEKLHSGELYLPGDKEIMSEQLGCLEKLYANFNLTLVDDTHIYVGDYTMFGPNVTIATAAHPIEPEVREQGYQYNKPVRIGKNCWIGAGAIIVPGITIGDHVVIGAGSVVTKDIPSNVVAVGNPCRVLREI
jgi:galactoside O-acetyltransferase